MNVLPLTANPNYVPQDPFTQSVGIPVRPRERKKEGCERLSSKSESGLGNVFRVYNLQWITKWREVRLNTEEKTSISSGGKSLGEKKKHKVVAEQREGLSCWKLKRRVKE